MYDVIVVGAGPAGSTAAGTLAQAGRRVLLLDRATFPRDKTCGDAVQAGAVEILRSLGYQSPINSEHFTRIVDWTIEAPSRAVLYARLQTGGHDPYIVQRLYFDELVYRQALANGAVFCQAQVTEPLVEHGRVIGVRAKMADTKKTVEWQAPVVIAADGATSIISRTLLAEKSQTQDVHRAVAIRCYVTMRQALNYRSEFYFPASIMPGYAWVFPSRENNANVGIGMRLDHYRRRGTPLDALLDKFLDLLGDRIDRASVTDVRSWQIPFGSRRFSRVFDGCLLVGDAGHFVDPLLGAGIYFGMKTGQLAAQTAHLALQKGDTSRQQLAVFDRSWQRELGWSLRRATLVQRLIIGQPWTMNSVVAIARLHPVLSRWVVKALSGEKI